MKARLVRWKRALAYAYATKPKWKALLSVIPISLCALRIRSIRRTSDPKTVNWLNGAYEATLKRNGRRAAAEFARYVTTMWYGL